MFEFYLRRTLQSLSRSPGLSAVMIVNMALGLAIWIIAYTSVEAQRRVPVTEHGTLFHVDWGSQPDGELEGLENYQRVQALAPHVLLSSVEADALAAHDAVRRHAKTFTSRLSVAGPRGMQPSAVRFCTRELFSLFELPFAFGGAWPSPTEGPGEPHADVVLDHASNQRFFGGQNSVGRSLLIDGKPFRVAGVLASTPTRLRSFDLAFSVAPAIYLPFDAAGALGVRPDYVAHRSSRQAPAALLESDEGFVQLWVELTSSDQRPRYEAFLLERARGLHGGTLQRRSMLQTPTEFLEYSVPISNAFFLFRATAFIALLACSVNLSRLLIVKFQARAPELAVQRALGATRQSVFAQHMLEAVVVAFAAIALGLVIAALGLVGLNSIVPDRPSAFALDLSIVAMTCSVGLGAGLLAGIHPAIRMCRSAPATFLRLQ